MAKREFLPALRAALRGAPETKGLPERVRASSSGYVIPGIPYRTAWDTKRAVEEGYEANPLVYRAVEVIATNAMRQPVVVFEGGTEVTGKKIDDPRADPTRLVYVLNRRANPWETGRIFRHRLVAQYLLSSKGCFVEVIRTRSNRIGMLNLVDPDLVSPIASETDPIHSFEIQTPNTSVRAVNILPRFDPNASVEDQPASILWVRSPHPLVMWKGMSPMRPAGLSVDLDRYARLYNRRFLQNDGRPGGLLSVKGNMSPDMMELIQAQFTGGPESPGRTTVISADQVSYADTSGSPRDLMWGDLSKATKEDIAMTFGVPMSIMGDASGETFDNADADWATFWESRMQPLLLLLDDQLDILTGGYDDDYLLRHDLSGVWVLGRHKREQQDRAAADLERGAITYDEYREETDREPLGVAATQVLWINAGGKMAAAKDAETAQAAIDTPTASAIGAAPAAPMGLTPAAPADALAPADNPGLRLLAGGRTNPNEQPNNLERADLLAGDESELEGKERAPRLEGSEPGAFPAWR